MFWKMYNELLIIDIHKSIYLVVLVDPLDCSDMFLLMLLENLVTDFFLHTSTTNTSTPWDKEEIKKNNLIETYTE